MNVLVFPGQGSQKIGMGHNLYENFQEARDVFDEVEELSPENYEEQEKVTTVAIDKFIDGEVKWRKAILK